MWPDGHYNLLVGNVYQTLYAVVCYAQGGDPWTLVVIVGPLGLTNLLCLFLVCERNRTDILLLYNYNYKVGAALMLLLLIKQLDIILEIYL